jgi:hypothetical protein
VRAWLKVRANDPYRQALQIGIRGPWQAAYVDSRQHRQKLSGDRSSNILSVAVLPARLESPPIVTWGAPWNRGFWRERRHVRSPRACN